MLVLKRIKNSKKKNNNNETDLFSGQSYVFSLESQTLKSTIPGIETVCHIEVEVAVDIKKIINLKKTNKQKQLQTLNVY